MRTVSQSTLQSMFSEDTASIYLMLLEVDHPSLDDPLRFVNNNEDIIHRATPTSGFPFKSGCLQTVKSR